MNASFSILALLSLSLLFAARGGKAATRTSAATPVAPDLSAINRYVSQRREAARIPGLALVVVQGDEIVYLQGYGKAGPDGRQVTGETPFIIGSNSKAFTAIAIMQLVEADEVALDTPVQRYLPWFRVADAGASARITVRHLLYHTSGMPTSAGKKFAMDEDNSNMALERHVRGLVALGTLVGLPRLAGLPLPILLRLQPDLAWTATGAGFLATLTTLLRAVAYIRRRDIARPNHTNLHLSLLDRDDG